MKRLLVMEILRRFQAHPNRKSLLKKIAAVGFIFLLSFGALGIWAGVAAVGYVSEVAQNPRTQEAFGELQAQIGSRASAVASVGCWTTASSLLRIQPWVDKPVGHHLANLKVACLEAEEHQPTQDGGNDT